jgi:3'-phosphoadenosine 5'-phosphosulfate (PAPS) 3'-phosphatase
MEKFIKNPEEAAMFQVTQAFDSFDVTEATVFIDPLDGTKEFLKGNLSAVTVLIGLAINGKSRAGIIHYPFAPENKSVGKTVFGTMEHGAYVAFNHVEMTMS